MDIVIPWQIVSSVAVIVGMLFSVVSLRQALVSQKKEKLRVFEETMQHNSTVINSIEALRDAITDQKILLHDINEKLDDHNVRLARLETEVFRSRA